MLIEKNIKVIKNGLNYISECEVVDSETNKNYYVVSQMPKTMYATFDSSYMDYILYTKKMPQMIEGEDYMFFDFEGRLNNTKFWNFYKKTYYKALEAKENEKINKKYSKIKKPKNINDYRIINKEKTLSYVGYSYEIVVNFYDHIYIIYKDDFSNYKIFEYQLNKKILLEEIVGYKKIKKSKFYPYYLLVEMYNDNYLM